MRVLIVDDDRVRAQRLQEYLTSKEVGISHVIHVEATDDAKNLLRASYYDVLILDVVLPKRKGESADYSHGLSLLRQVNTSAMLKKPEKVIGITSYLHDIDGFRSVFEEYCMMVIEAPRNSSQWKGRIVAALSYTFASKIVREASDRPINVLTVHGIQTFGGWQDRLKQLVELSTDSFSFQSYKYGYFSALTFLVPFLRAPQVRNLEAKIMEVVEADPEKELVIFCHSFGTFLVAHALRNLRSKGSEVPLSMLVLCGSVLPSSFDWNFLIRDSRVRIVNDCGNHDYVLWLSEALVLGVGMAGKDGFHGLNNSRFCNRYFNGGHSHYFRQEFIRRYWLPLLASRSSVDEIDERSPSPLIHGGIEQLVRLSGHLKRFVYLAVVIYVLVQILGAT